MNFWFLSVSHVWSLMSLVVKEETNKIYFIEHPGLNQDSIGYQTGSKRLARRCSPQSVNLFLNSLFFFLFFLVGRNKSIVWTRIDWTIQRYKGSWFLLEWSSYPPILCPLSLTPYFYDIRTRTEEIKKTEGTYTWVGSRFSALPRKAISDFWHSSLLWLWYICTTLNTRLILFTNPSARAGYDTRSIFKQSLTGLNSEFSFS